MMSSVSPTATETMARARPVSQANPDGETCLAPTTPFPGQSHTEVVDNTTNDKQVPNTASSLGAVWNGSETATSQRPSPDINVSLLSE